MNLKLYWRPIADFPLLIATGNPKSSKDPWTVAREGIGEGVMGYIIFNMVFCGVLRTEI